MSQSEWAVIAVSITTLIAAFSASVRFLVKHYLVELKPNSGGSMNDRLSLVESRVQKIYEILIEDRLSK